MDSSIALPAGDTARAPGSVIKLFGPSVYWAHVLATLCLLGTAVLTWLIGCELVGAHRAALVARDRLGGLPAQPCPDY
ncbi:MAG: hypothetical protein V4569_07365 [Pseudomonadota bacterium]